MKQLPDGTIVERALFQLDGFKGWFDRGFNEQRQEYVMFNSYFDPELPRWIQHVKVPLVEGKGIPTALYLDLYLMKKLDVNPKLLKTVRICNVHEWDSVFHLARLSRDNDETADLGALFKKTKLFHARNNVLIQTGLKINSLTIDPGGSQFSHPKDLTSPDNPHLTKMINGLCQKYNIEDQDQVFWNFDVVISVNSVDNNTAAPAR
jgi:hypothetical protein